MQIMDMLKKVGTSAGSSRCCQAAAPVCEALHAPAQALKAFTSPISSEAFDGTSRIGLTCQIRSLHLC